MHAHIDQKRISIKTDMATENETMKQARFRLGKGGKTINNQPDLMSIKF